jgi:hypothetical protein
VDNLQLVQARRFPTLRTGRGPLARGILRR